MEGVQQDGDEFVPDEHEFITRPPFVEAEDEVPFTYDDGRDIKLEMNPAVLVESDEIPVRIYDLTAEDLAIAHGHAPAQWATRTDGRSASIISPGKSGIDGS